MGEALRKGRDGLTMSVVDQSMGLTFGASELSS